MRVPTFDDREKLLNIPIRRISRFDLDQNMEEIAGFRSELKDVEKNLKTVKKYTINYLQGLIKKYGKDHKRLTRIKEIEQLDLKAIKTKSIKVGFDPESGFVGTKVSSDINFECTNFDKLLLIYKDGTYQVINIPEKQYVQKTGTKVAFAGVADKKTVFSVVYRDPKTHLCYAKRFIIAKFILEKTYQFIEEGTDLQFISTEPKLKVELQFIPKIKQKLAKIEYDVGTILVKGVSAKGIRMANREVKKVVLIK